MSLEPVLQPHVSCLGNPVAGNPTQFVMTRIAKSMGLDWRFFTSQVAVDQFETAFRGVQALGFNGVALFEPFQSAVVALLDSVTEAGLCLNQVNVARSDANSWLGDNTLGTALSNCLLSAFKGAPGTVIILGDSSIAKAMTLSESPWLTKCNVRVVQESATSATTNATSGDEGASESQDPSHGDGTVTLVESARQLYPVISLEDLSQFDSPIDALIVAEPIQAAALKKLPAFAAHGQILMAAAGIQSARAISLFAQERHLRCIEQVDLMAHQAAADFHFWTGVQPNVAPIRESLEEYLQW